MEGGTVLLKTTYSLMENSKKSENLSGFLWIEGSLTGDLSDQEQI